jgi:transposase InsO family protein
MLLDRLQSQTSRLPPTTVGEQGCFSRERLYRWRRGVTDRKVREQKLLPEQTVENAAAVVARFPHLGGRKGQAYMAYHGLGTIGQKAFDTIRRNVKRVLVQELSGRPDRFRPQEHYDHVRPTAPGEVWAEDFTELPVAGTVFRLAVVVDVFDHCFLGWAQSRRATATFASKPMQAALDANNGNGPEQFLLSDHGTQYTSETHGQLLSSAEIAHRLIPACLPQYNGTVESEMRTVKSVFYNVWERREREGADGKEKPLEERVNAALSETFRILNDEMPRPFLGGVTPADVHFGRSAAVQDRIRSGTLAVGEEQIPPWRRKYWDVLKDGVKPSDMSTRELQTKLAFFGLRPLRRIARLNQEVSGNYVAGVV